MSKVFTVAWRDFTQTVMRKVFLLAIIGMPVGIAAAMAIAVLLMFGHEEPPLIGTVAIVDPTGELTEAALAEFDPKRIARDRQKQMEQMQEAGRELLGDTGPADTIGAGSTATFKMGLGTGEVRIDLEHHESVEQPVISQLKARVRDGDLLAAAVIPAEVFQTPDPTVDDERPKFELFVAGSLDSDHTSFIERRLGQAVVRVRAARAELDPDEALAMLRRPHANTTRILESGHEASESEGVREAKQMIPFMFMMLLWIAVLTSAQHLMMTTIEEKSNRVMEVLLSAVSPLQLMTGKILGQSGVGLLIVVVYSSVAVGGLVTFALMHLIEITDLVYLFVYFFMAYFMIASIMAAVGSAVSDIREANTLVTPVMLLMMIPFVLWLPITQAPNGAVATTFSFIPPAVPFVMILRLAADEPVPLWQIPVSIVWGYACVVAMIWMAAKIFRIGVLMYGKPPSPIQLLKWLRYS